MKSASQQQEADFFVSVVFKYRSAIAFSFIILGRLISGSQSAILR